MDAQWLQRLSDAFQQLEQRCIDRCNQIIASHNIVAKQVADIIRAQRAGPGSSIDNQRALHATISDAARSYTNLVMIGGYAGLFGLWQMEKPLISNRTNAIVGTGIGLSILLFASFEVFKMINEAWHARNLETLLRDEKDFTEEERVRAWNTFVEASQRRVSRVWVWILIPTVVSGFGAGYYLLVELIRSLW